MANWTAVQACSRDLKPGETRKSLCAKVQRGLRKRMWHTVDPNIDAKLSELGGVATQSEHTA